MRGSESAGTGASDPGDAPAPGDPLTRLWRGAQRGDSAALDRLARALVPEITAILAREVRRSPSFRDAVGDLLGFAWITIQRNLGRTEARSDRELRAWISRVVFSTLRDAEDRVRARKRDPTAEVSLDEILSDGERAAPRALLTPDAETIERASLAAQFPRLRDAFRALPRDEQDAVWHIEVEGCSIAEAARILGVNAETLRSRLNRALARLARSMAREPGP